MSRVSFVITGELVGVARGDASVASTGVGGRLEARITCNQPESLTTVHEHDRYKKTQSSVSSRTPDTDTATGVCSPLW